MTTAFLEVPGNMVRETDERGAADGIPLGFRPIIEPEFPWSYFSDSTAAGSIRRP
jgi:hypothetical protein